MIKGYTSKLESLRKDLEEINSIDDARYIAVANEISKISDELNAIIKFMELYKR
jgi:hypothetical protein